MKMITDNLTYENAKYNEKIQLECQFCHKEFKYDKRFVKSRIKTNNPINYCSKSCSNLGRQTGTIHKCTQCQKEIYRTPSWKKKSKSNRVFCGQSCSGTYNNTHKTKGHRISKLEKWLQLKLPQLYPNLEFNFNQKNIIQSELDIYIPSLKLAFELNGIFHYEPIYGPEKLNQIQNNDHRKFAACAEQEISLCIIDASKQTYFKESTSIQYLNIITKIINEKLVPLANSTSQSFRRRFLRALCMLSTTEALKN